MKKPRKIFATALAVAMSLTMSIPAFAAEAAPADIEPVAVEAASSTDDADIMPLSYTNHTTVRTNGTWVAVATDSNGFNCNAVVSIPLLDGFNYKVDIGTSSTILSVSPSTVINDAFGQTSNSRTIPLGRNQVLFVRINPRTALGGGTSAYTVNTTINK